MNREQPICMRMTGKRTKLGLRIEQGLREALAWKRGEIQLEVRTVAPETLARRREHKRPFAKQLRTHATGTERMLWSLLRARKLGGKRFRRQQPIGPYIVDFYCSQARLIVELDGGQHSEKRNLEYDDERARFLNECGYAVLRITNHELLQNCDVVLERVWRAVKQRCERLKKLPSP